MARIRSIKPEHKQHRKVGLLTDRQYRLWIGLITEADDKGRLVAEPVQLRAVVFTYQAKLTVKCVADDLAHLDGLGLIRLYRVDEVLYAHFPSWDEHQRIDRPTPSVLPTYMDSSNDRRVLDESSTSPRSGSEGIGSDRKGSDRRGGNRGVAVPDDAFIAALKSNPAYQGIDIDRELGKLDAWLLTPRGQGKLKSRSRIVNWLNRCDKPVVATNEPKKVTKYGEDLDLSGLPPLASHGSGSDDPGRGALPDRRGIAGGPERGGRDAPVAR